MLIIARTTIDQSLLL